MNLLLALVLTAVVLYQGAEVPLYEDQPPVVGVVTAGSPAAKADIQPGDRIVARRRIARSTPGNSSSSPSDRGANRETRSISLRDGQRSTRSDAADAPWARAVRDRRHRRRCRTCTRTCES